MMTGVAAAGTFSTTITKGPGQDDPTSTSPINFKVVFAKAVSDFEDTDITITGTTGATTISKSALGGSGKNYNVAVSGMTGSGIVGIKIDGGKVSNNGDINIVGISPDVIDYAGGSAVPANCGNDDELTAGLTGTVFHAEAWNTCAKWYEIRFYAPGVIPGAFNPLSPTPAQIAIFTAEPPDTTLYPYARGLFGTQDYFWGEGCIESDKCVATYTPPSLIQGDWIIVLMKAGNSPNPPEYMSSYRVCTSVNVPIPEFATIALPIAAVLGLVFFFQHRKKKEE